MNNKYSILLILCFFAICANGQGVLKGTVYENGTNNRLTNVFIRDNNNKQQLTITDNQGNFSIKTEPGHVIIFDSPSYVSDTLYITDMVQKKIMLTTKTIALREVAITSTRTVFDPHKEYPDVYEKSKVYVMSPSTWFSKDAKDARRLKRYFETEQQERRIDAVFNRTYVGSLVPLKGRELESFMTIYRPTYATVVNSSGPTLAVYINDSYKKYQSLPPDKRMIQKLNDTVKTH